MALVEEATVAAPAEEGGRRRFHDIHTFRSLKNRDYRLLWIGMLGAYMTMNMQQVARGWLAYDLTGSASMLALVSLSWGAPMLVFSLPGGLAADRFEKKNVMVASQLAGGVAAVAIALLVAAGAIQIWHLIVAGVIQGTGFAFNLPARQAIIRELVSDEELINAIALNNAGMNLMRIIGPSVAGILIATPLFGVKGVYFLMAGIYVAVSWTLYQLPKTREQRLAAEGRTGERGGGSPLGQIRAGLTYILQNPNLRVLMSLAFIPILVGFPYQILLPVMSGEHGLDVGARGLGAMSTAVGAGALIGSLMVASLANFHRRAFLQMFMGVGFGVGLVAFGVSPTLVLAMGALAVVGFAADAYSSLNNTMIMTNTDRRFQGRVMSVYLMTFAAMPIGSVPMSAISDVIGIRHVLILMGVIVAGFVGAVGLLYPRYRRIT